MNRKISNRALGFAGILSVFFVLSWQGVSFNYDFENFFQQDDPDLDFYQEYRTTFQNDNDYLLLALKNERGIFDSAFLAEALAFSRELHQMEGVDKVISILEQKEPVIGPFGINYRPLLDWSSGETLSKSAENIKKDRQWKGNLFDEQSNTLLLLVENKQMITKEQGDALYANIEQQLKTYEFDGFKTAGKIKAQGAFVALLQEEFSFFLAFAMCGVLFLLWLMYRSWWGVILPFIIIITGIFWSLAFLLLTGGELDVMSVMQPPILMVIGLSGMVHVVNHYQSALTSKLPKEEAIYKAFKALGLPVFLTALTTSLGFVSLYFTNVPSLMWFGVYTGCGVMFMFLALFSILPFALYHLPPLPSSNRELWAKRWAGLLKYLYVNTVNKRKLVFIGFVLITLVAGYCMSRVKTNGYLLDSLPEGHALLEDFRFFDENYGGSKPLEIYLQTADDSGSLLDYQVLQEIKKLEEFIGENYNSAFIMSPLTAVKAVNKAQNRGNAKAFTLPSALAYERMQPLIERIGKTQNLKLWTEDKTEGRLSSRTADNGSLIGKWQKQKLEDFVAKNIDGKLLQVRLTGTSFLIDKSHELVTYKVFTGLGFAFLLVGIIIGFLFRSWRVSFLVLLPNIVPLVWVGCVMYWFGIEFKLSTSIVFAIAFGIAVDDSIHFMTNLRMQMMKGQDLPTALFNTFQTTGKAIVLTTIILVSGFAMLTFSDLEIPWFTGVLVSLSLIFAVLADLFWLPVLLIPFKNVIQQKVNRRLSAD
ncbi:MMPL family transporter [Cyclobacterium sp. 1_MG-2023]|uniref:efflux RND transporter permease subunit n=1 Tax=Cyclobacterium sp. 1_MG-2023 TaxID=3062681 RepID=UPI0026E3934B|nr:MMPL family transporter [Cyclobacterium sp. 1_MG-2023]MDO6437302.1 MMPL family transporter [Cyclobacterium sp. 1_MG-2023]